MKAIGVVVVIVVSALLLLVPVAGYAALLVGVVALVALIAAAKRALHPAALVALALLGVWMFSLALDASKPAPAKVAASPAPAVVAAPPPPPPPPTRVGDYECLRDKNMACGSIDAYRLRDRLALLDTIAARERAVAARERAMAHPKPVQPPLPPPKPRGPLTVSNLQAAPAWGGQFYRVVVGDVDGSPVAIRRDVRNCRELPHLEWTPVVDYLHTTDWREVGYSDLTNTRQVALRLCA